MIKCLFATFVLSAASFANAQSVSFDSVRLADMTVESSWSSMQQLLPPLFVGVESQLRAGGVSERASKVFVEELRGSMNRDNLSRAIAAAVTASFTTDEIKETVAFLQGKAGQKLLSLNKDVGTSKAYVPIVKQACASAVQRLEPGAERSSISDACSRL